MALVWVATAAINIGPIRAYNPGNIVPDSAVANLGLADSGLVTQVDRDVEIPPPWYGVNPVTQAEFDALTTGTGRLSETELKAAYVARQANADSVAFMGDSITTLNGTGDNVSTFHIYSDNYTSFLTTLLNGQVRFINSFATGGLTAAQIRDQVLPRLLATPQSQWPGSVILLAGTNDVGASIPAATTISAINDIYNTLVSNGIRLICATIPPRGDSSTPNQLVGPLNQAIQKFARAHGLHCLPFHAALVAATGGYTSGLAIADNIHPSRLGMLAMAQAAVNAGISQAFPVRGAPLTVKSNADTTDQLAGKGLFLTDTNADGVADNWSAGGTTVYTPSLVAPSGGDNLAGNWQRMVVASGATGSGRYLQYVGSVTCNAGDVLEVAGRIRITGATAGLTTSSPVKILFGVRGQSSPASDWANWGSSVDISGTFNLRQVAYTGTNQVSVTVQPQTPSTGSLTLDVGEIAVRNLTALGLA